jgi:integrase
VLKNPSLTRFRVAEMPKVKTFLESVERNSKDTRSTYHLGLTWFQDFLDSNSNSNVKVKLDLETVLQHLAKNKIDVYELLDGFVSYLMKLKPEPDSKLSIQSMKVYLTGVKSYFGYYNIDVIPAKFRRRVKMPKLPREDEEPIDATDIRKILLACNNRRLKSYLLVLASGGMRAKEGLAIRLKDIDFSVSPTKIHIRSEYAKTRVSRDIYISDEATQYLEQWIDWKYRDKSNEGNGLGRSKTKHPDNLVFSVYSTDNKPNPSVLYVKILSEFEKLLSIAVMDERKEGMRRHLYTLHSMRRHAKTVISNQANTDFSEYFLGHSKSPYYTLKEPERREIYATKVMRYLTFLDYSYLESTSKNIEEKLIAREQEIYMLKQNHVSSTDAIAALGDQINEMNRKIAKLEKMRNYMNTNM